ncbi:hypothetical protein [Ruegeria arenilitoris]|uniref:hypothetical protein n=1 Tax=Ruegeria arenilitoris TaxID=1173585 RepID=UPI00147F161D|nr:hypothetical protein [Ruegeria arenilitoris]
MRKHAKKAKASENSVKHLHLYIPLHNENWALSLSRGYLGYPPTEDTVQDVQARYSQGTVGFEEMPPSWAMECDEPGAIIVLKATVPSDLVVKKQGTLLLPGLTRISSVKEAIFANQSELDNFVASYAAFPDVPVDLVPCGVSSQPGDLFAGEASEEAIENLEETGKAEFEERDLYCGWSTGLVNLMETGGFDGELKEYIARVDRDKSANAFVDHVQKILLAFDPEATEVDLDIWSAVADTAMNSRSRHGFDRLRLVESVEGWLSDKGKTDPKYSRWLEVAKDVVSARRDPPPLNDDGSLGQRAGVAFLLAHDPETIEFLEAGEKVKALVSTLAMAFLGYARSDLKFKKPLSKMDGILTLAEAIEAGSAGNLLIETGRLDKEMNENDIFAISGKEIARRVRSVSSYGLMLRARAMEAGMRLLVDEDHGRLYLDLGDQAGLKIFIDQEASAKSSQPVVRFWAPLVEMKARTPGAAAVRKLLEKSWATGCALGINSLGDKDYLCAFVTQLTNTLDRDEFDAHVTSIKKMATTI